MRCSALLSTHQEPAAQTDFWQHNRQKELDRLFPFYCLLAHEYYSLSKSIGVLQEKYLSIFGNLPIKTTYSYSVHHFTKLYYNNLSYIIYMHIFINYTSVFGIFIYYLHFIFYSHKVLVSVHTYLRSSMASMYPMGWQGIFGSDVALTLLA